MTSSENKAGSNDDTIPIKVDFWPGDVAVAPTVQKPSPMRFLVLLLLSLSLALNGFILNTYVTIWYLAMDVYSVSSLDINMFSMVYAIFYIPGSIMSIATYARFGLSYCTLGGAIFNFLCCWVRVAGSYSFVPYNAYTVMLFGQILAAIGQPLLLNAPVRVANDWFPSHERDIAMHVMTQAQNIGGGLGAIIPAYQVSVGTDIPHMLVWQGVASSGILIFSIIMSPFRPPVHAEYDATVQDAIRSQIDQSDVFKIYTQMIEDFRVMLKNRNFVLLLAAFSIQVGISWVFMAVVGQMISPCGYDITVVGGALAGLSFAGVFGSFCIAWILRRYKSSATWYVHMQKLWFLLATATCLWCMGVNAPGNITLVICAWIAYGFITGPLTPITLEHAAEITYPIPADNSAALLFTGVNMVFLAVTLGITPLLTDNVSMTCESIVTPSSALLFFFIIIGGFIAFPMTAEFRRKAVNDKAEEQRLAWSKERAAIDSAETQQAAVPADSSK